jgi:hypothetical protein
VARGLDGARAIGRADAELVRQGVTGAVRVDSDVVRVTVTSSVDFVILPGGATVSGSAVARAVHGVHRGSD